MGDLPNFLGMAEEMFAAAEAGDVNGVESARGRFIEAGGQHYENLCEQGFSDAEILSGAYLRDPRYIQG